MEIAQKLAGYTLGNADLLRRAMARRRRRCSTPSTSPSPRACWPGVHRGHPSAAYGVRLVPFSGLRVQQGPHRGIRLVSYWTAYLKANYPRSTWPDMLTTSATHKASRRSTSAMAAAWHQGAPRTTSTTRSRASPPWAPRTSCFGMAAIRNVGQNVVERHPRDARGQGRLHLVPRLPLQVPGRGLQQADHRVAHQGGGVRRPRRDPGRAAARARGGRRRVRRDQAPGGDRPGLALRAFGGRRR